MSTLSAERFEDHYPLLPSPVAIRPYHIEFELKERSVVWDLNFIPRRAVSHPATGFSLGLAL